MLREWVNELINGLEFEFFSESNNIYNGEGKVLCIFLF